MKKNSLKEKLAAGKRAAGLGIPAPLPALAEIAGLAGFDFLFIDAEHGPLSEGDCQALVTAAELGERLGVTPAGTGARSAALLGCFALPVDIPCPAADYAAAVGLDKKGAGDDISVILLEAVGRAVPRRMPKAELTALLEETL